MRSTTTPQLQSSSVQSKCCNSALVKCVPTTTRQQHSDYLNDELQ